MKQLYSTLISLGIILVCILILWILRNKKRTCDNARKIDKKTKNLMEVVLQAEQMLEEMNRFSSYMVELLEDKNSEVLSNLKAFDERVRELNITAEDCLKDIPDNIYLVKEESKVIPINSKYRDVVNMSQKGMSAIEIAKELNVGKGEIELILGLNK